MNDSPSGVNDKRIAGWSEEGPPAVTVAPLVTLPSKTGMHDIGRNIIMGGSSGQTALVTTTTTTPGTPLNGLAATVLESSSSTTTTTTVVVQNNIHNNSSNGIHHRTSVTTTTSSSASSVDSVDNHSVGNATFQNNNNCVKRQPVVIKCSARNDNSEETLELGQSHVMSDGPTDRTVVNSKPQPPQETLTVSSSSSAASSRSSSLSTSPRPMMLIRGDTEEEAVAITQESRKVEPLKINLHREPIRTVIKLGGSPEVSLVPNHVHAPPKITIKPIPNPVPVVSSTNEQEEVIPKLHIRMNNLEAVPQELQVTAIPKLTIRNATTGNAAAVETGTTITTASTTEHVVPKLTIKMAQQPSSPAVPKLTIKTNNITASEQHLTVPKLTIKVANDQTTTTSNCSSSSGSVSPGSAVISSSSTVNCAVPTEAGAIPKLTLKTVHKAAATTEQQPHQQHDHRSEEASFKIVNSSTSSSTAVNSDQQQAVPKLTVKLARPCPPVPSEDDDGDEEEEEESERSLSDAEEAKRVMPRIPKLTIKSVVSSPPKTFGTSQQQQQATTITTTTQNEVPKLVIKSIPKQETNSSAAGGDQYQHQVTAVNHVNHLRHPGVTLGSGDVLPLDVGSPSLNAVGPQSPRIILKINKNQNSIVSNTTTENEVPREEQENLLKRHLLQQDIVNNTPKRCKAEERIIAVIDLDDESDSKSSTEAGERNGRPRRLLANNTAKEAAPVVVGESDATRGVKQPPPDSVAIKNCTQSVPEDYRQGLEGSDAGVEEAEDAGDRLQAMDDVLEEMQTPVVKRGRGRPRKTPVTARADLPDTM